MRRVVVMVFLLSNFWVGSVLAPAFSAEKKDTLVQTQPSASTEYRIGVDDVLDITVLQPEKLAVTVTVAPDGTINFPYIGPVKANGLTLVELQSEIQKRLSEGYMKYPVVSVFLRENRSKKFFVYGEVVRPGTYSLEENMTVIKAISVAGGFTKFGSASRVKVLRPKEDKAGYEAIKVNINAAMAGDSNADLVLRQGDIVVVSESAF
ncbi:MAG: polysaccharide export protein [Candidatus Omnitrophica bacterium]|nr:polysaccharide export protein [Candidatus Omnitrophota bacterium]